MPVQDLAVFLCRAEVAFPRLDVAWVDAGCVVEISAVEGVRVPGWVVVHGEAKPIGCVGEGCAAEEDEGGEDLSAGLQARVDEVPSVVTKGG